MSARRWRKLGRIYDAAPLHEKLVSHAANPLPVHLSGDVFRIFFSGRDKESRSSVGFADIDIATGSVLGVSEKPAFQHGPSGSFYSHGVSIGNCYRSRDGHIMLFMGWRIPDREHWRGEIGSLKVGTDLSLSLHGDSPLIGLSPPDPVSLSYPWVFGEEGGGFCMWYGSTVAWDAGNGEMLHVIKHARSSDGRHWELDGKGVPYEIGVAQAFSRPTVARSDDGWHMWFSFRSGRGLPYRIGYAHSHDGAAWELRLDEAGIDVSSSGWDSEMIEYPFVFEHRDALYMLYNGNGYGKTGFGLAIAETV